MKTRILFVDDEPQILKGLEGRLRRQRKKWTMFFASGGHEALELLRDQPIDVIVSDMRMPRMDGATLLQRVKQEYPDVVRLVLSGHAELETALRAVPVAHQFLAKPCDAGLLENVVTRACNLQKLISDDVLRSAIGKIETLPSLPRVHTQLMVAMADERASTDEIAKILKQDMAMCAKLLQIVNSAFFRLSRTIARIEDAVSYLGFSTIRQLALTIHVFGQHGGCSGDARLSLDALQQHSVLVASIASRMFSRGAGTASAGRDDKQLREDAFVAGLLHDIGILLLVLELPQHVEELQQALPDGGALHLAEQQLWGVTHAEVGAYLLGLWGLPYPIVEAVANHHAPGRVDQHELDLLAAVHLADTLAREQVPFSIGGSEQEQVEVDTAYLQRLGLSDKLDGWREMAKERADAMSEGAG